MNIKCPYCGCCYEINHKLLGNPIGNEKLGYGWWLRCYRCHKKWWLKNSYVEQNFNTPLKADKTSKIGRLNSLIKNHDKKEKKQYNFAKLLKYILISVFITGAITCYCFRDNFLNYINTKALHLRENISSKFELLNVKYNIDNNNLITVTGNIFNKDNKNILTANGIRINIFRKNEKIDSWNNEFDGGAILPQQSIPFSSSKHLQGNPENITVEVLVY
ncbi:MAG: hypothetical protein Q4E61_02030 [Alphaproteobacteria bacterium]|nr:hypothetical protein [Alphaproteobacteria bacterium]